MKTLEEINQELASAVWVSDIETVKAENKALRAELAQRDIYVKALYEAMVFEAEGEVSL